MNTCLVTGGAGFIGSHVVRRLLAEGYRVRVLDDLSTGRRANLADVGGELELIEGDICNPDAVARAVRGADVVFHLAARASVPRSVEQPRQSHDINVNGTFNMLMAARDAGVRRFVYSASSSAYGDTPVLPKREDMAPLPLSPYAVSKLVGEYYCRVFSEVYGLETVSLRYFNVFGPRQDPNSQYAAVIPAFVTRMCRGEAPIIFGDGEQSRDFCFIDNVVDANLRGATVPNLRGEVVNIACGERTTLNHVVQVVNRALGVNISPEYRDARAGDVRHSLADVTEAARVLGYEPRVRFAEGLERAIEWYRCNPS
ncbi:MAG: SDR family oxidoreductase [Planctomycetia bacterium]|nr:MAG: SDR family oxidoreductase [Planctomycetia bacterium]